MLGFGLLVNFVGWVGVLFAFSVCCVLGLSCWCFGVLFWVGFGFGLRGVGGFCGLCFVVVRFCLFLGSGLLVVVVGCFC